LLLHHQEYQIGIYAVSVSVVSDQSIESAASRAPTTFLGTIFCDHVPFLGVDPINAATFDKNGQWSTLVPNTFCGLRRAVSFDACATLQINPGWFVIHAVLTRRRSGSDQWLLFSFRLLNR